MRTPRKCRPGLKTARNIPKPQIDNPDRAYCGHDTHEMQAIEGCTGPLACMGKAIFDLVGKKSQREALSSLSDEHWVFLSAALQYAAIA
mmetsp:Transcript_16712/g.46015  ORF Transcript_16712/g.46015 Transcript_16712/m.46015 type:complete len:89 (-) Transcript_16712:419-685(-)|eukprot:1160186-Pelagomonas_calceolata.AAC.4